MNRSELIASTRFQQSIEAIVRNSKQQPSYDLQATVGILGARDPSTGDREFIDPSGVSSTARDLMTGAYPLYNLGSEVQVGGGQNYVR